ncbi:hypothetical protein Tco_1253226 [Tanacetum coccineum]
MNEKAVEKRTYEGCCQKWQILDLGPQLPTHVTNIVKSGTNLLQAVGNFDGKYIILVAFMSVGSNLRCPELPDYVVPAAAASDSGILHTIHAVEAVNCYIKRIYTPVKGPLCKHLQVLKEVGENVSHVKLFGDGSRFTFDECDGHANKPKYKPPVPQESPTSIADPNIIILTEGDNDMDSNPNQVDKNPTPA